MKIYRIIKTQSADTSFKEFIESEWLIDEKTFNAELIKSGLEMKNFGQIRKVEDMWFEYEDGTYTVIDIDSWISDLDISDALEFAGVEEDDIYISDLSSIREFKKYLGKVYHYTTEEAWDEIKKTGYLNPSHGTGINNRGAYGIFASIDPEEYALGTYGNICLEIDLLSFKQGEGLNSVEVDIEPEIKEEAAKQLVRHKLGLPFINYVTQDISPNTIIINERVPTKYIRVFGK